MRSRSSLASPTPRENVSDRAGARFVPEPIEEADEEGGNTEGGDGAFTDWFIVASLIQRF